MNARSLSCISLLVILGLLVSACGGTEAPPTAVPPAAATTAPEPTATTPPEPTSAPAEPSATPQAKPDLRVVPGVVNVDSLNLRLGPGLDHVVIRLLHTGQELDILGRNEKLDWLLVELPSGTQGWVYFEYVDTEANIAELPLKEAYGGSYFVEPA